MKKEKNTAQNPDLSESWWNKTRALIIDDEKPVRSVIRDMLETQGYIVDDAPDGETGMEKFRVQPADLVITDIIMLQKGGFEVIWDLRKEYPEVKIIAISGGGLIDKQDVLRSAERMGAHCCLQKPFDVEELISAIKSLGF